VIRERVQSQKTGPRIGSATRVCREPRFRPRTWDGGSGFSNTTLPRNVFPRRGDRLMLTSSRPLPVVNGQVAERGFPFGHANCHAGVHDVCAKGAIHESQHHSARRSGRILAAIGRLLHASTAMPRSQPHRPAPDQGTVKASSRGSYATRPNNLGDWPLNTGAGHAVSGHPDQCECSTAACSRHAQHMIAFGNGAA